MLGSIISKFDAKAKNHIEQQSLNPFSGSFSRSPSPRLSKDQYGKPLAGSKTEERGQRAKCHILREIQDLCNCIHDVGVYNKTNKHNQDSDDEGLNDDEIIITFGEIFQIYTKINDKVVGLLIAAKKRGFVYFEKEILFQRRDDDVLIALIKPIEEIRAIINKELASNSSPTPFASREVSPAVDSDESSHQSTSKKKKVVKHKKHHDEKEHGEKHDTEQHEEVKDNLVICNGESGSEKTAKGTETPERDLHKRSSRSSTPSQDKISESTNQLNKSEDLQVGSEPKTNSSPSIESNDKAGSLETEQKEKTPEPNVEHKEPIKIPTLEITSVPDNDDSENIGKDQLTKQENLPSENKIPENEIKENEINQNPSMENHEDKSDITDLDSHEMTVINPNDAGTEKSIKSGQENNDSSLETSTTQKITNGLKDLELDKQNDSAKIESAITGEPLVQELDVIRSNSKSPVILQDIEDPPQAPDEGKLDTVISPSTNDKKTPLANELLDCLSSQSDGCISPDLCDQEVQQILQSHTTNHVSSYTSSETTYEETTYEETEGNAS